MTLPPFAKALVAAAAGAITPPLASAGVAAATSTAGPSGTTSIVESVVGLVVSGVLTYLVPNGKPKISVGDLVVTVKTDADKFAIAFLAGVPGLVRSALAAAVGSTPAASAPAAETSAAPPAAPVA